MSGQTSNSELNELKVRIKKWERSFYKKEGRKADKADIDGNDEIRLAYKRYWYLVKFESRPSRPKEKSVSYKTRKKEPLRELHRKKLFSDQQANKLLKHFVNVNIESKSSFSLKKKPKPPVVENTNVNKENETAIIDVNFADLEETVVIKDSLAEEITQIVGDSNFWFIPQEKVPEASEPDVVTEVYQVEEGDIPVAEVINEAEVVTEVDSGVAEIESNTTTDATIQVISENDIITDVDIEEATTVTSKNNEFHMSEDSPEKVPDKSEVTESPKTVTSLFKRITSQPFDDKDSDYCTFESGGAATSLNFDVFDFHENDEPVADSENTIDLSKIKAQVKRKRSKKSDDKKPAKKIKSTSSERKSEKKSKETSSDKKNDVDYTPEGESEDEVKKPKVRRKKAAPKGNYQRLNLRKKKFASRGYKQFNSKRYKYQKWKKLKRNRCFKCGEPDHWAQDCPMKDVIDEMNSEELFHKSHQTPLEEEITPVFIPAKPVLEDSSDCDEMLNDALFALGFKRFKPNQQPTMKRILCGQSTIFVSPTGSGKSLCYQLPAYLYWKHKKSITLVVSPLISLMEDQLACLPKCLKAVSIHSGLKPDEKQAKMAMAREGNAQIIFLSPEMIVGSNYLDFSLLPSIAFVCVDEAHCLSEWSNNFRPSYLQLYKIMREKFNVETFLALTATATKQTITQIIRNLELDVDSVIGETTVPQNLNLTVSHDVDKDHALIELLKSDRFINKKSIIIYCTRREITEKIATFIRIEMQNITFETSSGKEQKYDARAYHAGLMSDERSRIQKRFLKGDLRVVVATIAFGMGINKSDVEGVIHYNLPRSFESYVQEIGRAGRNGSQAECHLFLDSNGSDLYELRKHVYANSVDRRSLQKLLQKVFKSCKCNVFNSVEECQTRCEGHEVAFPTKETVLELDMTEETILTLLCFLQLNYTKFSIELMPHIYSTCKILCYKEGGKQMDAVAKRCPPLSIALTLHKKENKLFETPSMFSFRFVEVAAMLGQSSNAVRKQLKRCEWEKGPNEQIRRTNVRVQFNDLSFHLKAPGDLSDSEFEEVLEFLHKYVTSQEKKEISKLINVYETFREFSEPKACKSLDSTKSEKLKQVVNKYFSNEDKRDVANETLTDSQLERWLGSSVSQRSVVQSLLEVDKIDIENARCDVKDLITIHSDQQFTARSIARILQGIGSPKYPIEVWSKVRRFWRSYIHMDFNILMKVANEELIRLKTTF